MGAYSMLGLCLAIVSVRIWLQCGFAATNSSKEEGAATAGGIAAIDTIVGTAGGDPAALGEGSFTVHLGRMCIGRRAQWGACDVARLARWLQWLGFWGTPWDIHKAGCILIKSFIFSRNKHPK